VLNASKPVVVDFWAEWCSPCRMIAPALEELSAELQDKVTVAKLNIDERSRHAAEIWCARRTHLDDFSQGSGGRHQGRRAAEIEDQGMDRSLDF